MNEKDMEELQKQERDPNEKTTSTLSNSIRSLLWIKLKSAWKRSATVSYRAFTESTKRST